jgi:integration host factor subunit alpha
MTKAELAEKVSEKVVLSKKESLELVEKVFETLKETLESGEKIKIPGLGNFVVKAKSDRRGRNPQTGAAITIEARKVLTFKPSMKLKESLNK